MEIPFCHLGLSPPPPLEVELRANSLLFIDLSFSLSLSFRPSFTYAQFGVGELLLGVGKLNRSSKVRKLVEERDSSATVLPTFHLPLGSFLCSSHHPPSSSFFFHPGHVSWMRFSLSPPLYNCVLKKRRGGTRGSTRARESISFPPRSFVFFC